MVVNSPLIRPAISWGGALGGLTLDSLELPNPTTMNC